MGLPCVKEEEVMMTRVKRNEKGQPFVQGSDGDWLLVRASSKTAGMLYLRDSIGRVYRLAVLDRVQAQPLCKTADLMQQDCLGRFGGR